jgi:hypothetical protein
MVGGPGWEESSSILARFASFLNFFFAILFNRFLLGGGKSSGN